LILITYYPSIPFRIDAAAVVARENKVEVVVTTLGNLWLLNRCDNNVELSHGELFGFNVGSYAEIPSGLNKLMEK
jgi:hypothetical protein